MAGMVRIDPSAPIVNDTISEGEEGAVRWDMPLTIDFQPLPR
jgi:hypothetical protein